MCFHFSVREGGGTRKEAGSRRRLVNIAIAAVVARVILTVRGIAWNAIHVGKAKIAHALNVEESHRHISC